MKEKKIYILILFLILFVIIFFLKTNFLGSYKYKLIQNNTEKETKIETLKEIKTDNNKILKKKIIENDYYNDNNSYIFDDKEFRKVVEKYGKKHIKESILGIGYINNSGIIKYGIEKENNKKRKEILENIKKSIKKFCSNKINYGDTNKEELKKFYNDIYFYISKKYFLKSELVFLLKRNLKTECIIGHIQTKDFILNGLIKNILEEIEGINILSDDLIFYGGIGISNKDLKKIKNIIWLDNFITSGKVLQPSSGKKKPFKYYISIKNI